MRLLARLGLRREHLHLAHSGPGLREGGHEQPQARGLNRLESVHPRRAIVGLHERVIERDPLIADPRLDVVTVLSGRVGGAVMVEPRLPDQHRLPPLHTDILRQICHVRGAAADGRVCLQVAVNRVARPGPRLRLRPDGRYALPREVG